MDSKDFQYLLKLIYINKDIISLYKKLNNGLNDSSFIGKLLLNSITEEEDILREWNPSIDVINTCMYSICAYTKLDLIEMDNFILNSLYNFKKPECLRTLKLLFNEHVIKNQNDSETITQAIIIEHVETFIKLLNSQMNAEKNLELKKKIQGMIQLALMYTPTFEKYYIKNNFQCDSTIYASALLDTDYITIDKYLDFFTSGDEYEFDYDESLDLNNAFHDVYSNQNFYYCSEQLEKEISSKHRDDFYELLLKTDLKSLLLISTSNFVKSAEEILLLSDNGFSDEYCKIILNIFKEAKSMKPHIKKLSLISPEE